MKNGNIHKFHQQACRKILELHAQRLVHVISFGCLQLVYLCFGLLGKVSWSRSHRFALYFQLTLHPDQEEKLYKNETKQNKIKRGSNERLACFVGKSKRIETGEGVDCSANEPLLSCWKD